MSNVEKIRCHGCNYVYLSSRAVSKCPRCGKTNYGAISGIIIFPLVLLAGALVLLVGALAWTIIAKKKSLHKIHYVGAILLGIGSFVFCGQVGIQVLFVSSQDSSDSNQVGIVFLMCIGCLLNITAIMRACVSLLDEYLVKWEAGWGQSGIAVIRLAGTGLVLLGLASSWGLMLLGGRSQFLLMPVAFAVVGLFILIYTRRAIGRINQLTPGQNVVSGVTQADHEEDVGDVDTEDDTDVDTEVTENSTGVRSIGRVTT
jgi:hypothetical protein